MLRPGNENRFRVAMFLHRAQFAVRLLGAIRIIGECVKVVVGDNHRVIARTIRTKGRFDNIAKQVFGELILDVIPSYRNLIPIATRLNIFRRANPDSDRQRVVVLDDGEDIALDLHHRG